MDSRTLPQYDWSGAEAYQALAYPLWWALVAAGMVLALAVL